MNHYSIPQMILLICVGVMFSTCCYALYDTIRTTPTQPDTEVNYIYVEAPTTYSQDASHTPLKSSYNREIECLALNIYHEARGSSVQDMISTGYVVFERVLDRRWPSTVCGVVFQKNQFSWTSDDISDIPAEPQAWELSKLVAQSVYHGAVDNPVKGANHYHTFAVNPPWSKKATWKKPVGSHNYMRIH